MEINPDLQLEYLMLKLVGLFIFCFNVLFCSIVVSKIVVLKKMKKFSNARNGNHGSLYVEGVTWCGLSWRAGM